MLYKIIANNRVPAERNNFRLFPPTFIASDIINLSGLFFSFPYVFKCLISNSNDEFCQSIGKVVSNKSMLFSCIFAIVYFLARAAYNRKKYFWTA